jgi:hypothetical protein
MRDHDRTRLVASGGVLEESALWRYARHSKAF